MVIPLNQTIQTAGKCPHGLPIGACPICSGMGGGSIKKDRDKPRVAGEMSYNECMAEWMKILAAKDAKIQAKIDRIEINQQKLVENRMMLGQNPKKHRQIHAKHRNHAHHNKNTCKIYCKYIHQTNSKFNIKSPKYNKKHSNIHTKYN